MMPRRAPVDVFAFRSFRAFLQAFLERKRDRRSGFSHAEFARQAGMRSPNYLKLVIEGRRNLGVETAVRVGEACGLSGDSLGCFLALVAYEQAKSPSEREHRYRALQRFPRFRKSHRLGTAQSAYHSEWYIPAVHELCARRDFRNDPKWIADTLLPRISAKQAERAIRILTRLKLLASGPDGRLRQASPVVETSDGPLGHQVAQFHRAMMERAAQSIDLLPRDDREIACLTLCISDDNMRALKAELEAFRTHLLERYTGDACPERVVQVNFQMFPLSRGVGDESTNEGDEG